MSFLKLTATAADGAFSLGGNAAVVADNPPHQRAIQLPSTCSGNCLQGPPPDHVLTTASVIWLPDHTLRLEDINHLSVAYRRTTGNCGGGSPRFEIGIDVNEDGLFDDRVISGLKDGRVFVYLGDHPDFRTCSLSWENTGNLILRNGEERVDSMQVGGQFYGTYAQALGVAGNKPICYIILVVDGGWFPNLRGSIPPSSTDQQIFRVDDVRVNNDRLRGNQATSLTSVQEQGPTLARLALEQYATGVSGPRDPFSADSYYGRRYAWRNTLRSLLRFTQRQTEQRRGVTRSVPE